MSDEGIQENQILKRFLAAIFLTFFTFSFSSDGQVVAKAAGQVKLEGDSEIFLEECRENIDAISKLILSRSLITVNDIAHIWASAGFAPSLIDPELSHSDTIVLANPSDNVPSAAEIEYMCQTYQDVNDRYVGSTVAYESDGSVYSSTVYNVDPEEKSRIPGTWTLFDFFTTEELSSARASLQTMTVAFHHVKPKRGANYCSVFFYVGPSGTAPKKSANLAWAEEIFILRYTYFGIHMIAMFPKDENFEIIRFALLENRDYSSVLSKIVDQSYSAYDGGIDWVKLSRNIKLYLRSNSGIAPLSLFKAEPREENNLVNSFECAEALGKARDLFALSAK